MIRLIWSSLLDELIALYDCAAGGLQPCPRAHRRGRNLTDPGLPRYAATVAGRGISLAVLVQDHNQLEPAYGKYPAMSLINNMETQLYYRQSGLDTAEYLEKRMGRKSEYAHSKTLHDGRETAEGKASRVFR